MLNGIRSSIKLQKLSFREPTFGIIYTDVTKTFLQNQFNRNTAILYYLKNIRIRLTFSEILYWNILSKE